MCDGNAKAGTSKKIPLLKEICLISTEVRDNFSTNEYEPWSNNLIFVTTYFKCGYPNYLGDR